MHKAYLSILLLFVSLVINSVVSSSYIPLHEGMKRKKKKSKMKMRKSKKQKRRASRRRKARRALANRPKKDPVVVVDTVNNIVKDTIPATNKVQLIKSFITQQ